jgi:transketolase
MNLKPLPVPCLLSSPLKTIPEHPLYLKSDPQKRYPLADPKRARMNLLLMNAYAVQGGAACHWGGPSAIMELLSAIHTYMFIHAQESQKKWYDLFHFVNDIGHAENGIYALRSLWNFPGTSYEELIQFRSLQSHLTGHGESHVYPQGVLISNGPLGSAVGQAQGLCLADRLASSSHPHEKNHPLRTTICLISDGAMMEGEAKEVLASIPGLAKKEKLNPFLLILSDNNTKLSGRIDADSFSMSPSFSAMKELGWHVVTLSHGNHLEEVFSQLLHCFELLKNNPHQPIFFHLHTVKGYGLKKTEQSASGGHGYPFKKKDPELLKALEEIWNGELPIEYQSRWKNLQESQPSPSTAPSLASTPRQTTISTNFPHLNFEGVEKIQEGISKALIDLANEGFPLFSLSSDLAGSTGLAAFQKRYPQLSLDIGVSESNMISTASGLSKAGFIPLVDTFAQFGVTKGLLPLTMGLLSQAPCLAFFSHTGMQDAADGASHQATTYLSSLGSLPNTVCIQLGHAEEAYHYTKQAVEKFHHDRQMGKTPCSTIFFLGRELFPSSFLKKPSSPLYPWGAHQVLYHSPESQILILTTGSMSFEGIKALPLLLEQSIPVTLLHVPFVNRPHIPSLLPLIEKNEGRLVIWEDHQRFGGFGSFFLSYLHQFCQETNTFLPPLRVKLLGLKEHFGRSSYSSYELYDHFQIGTQDLLESCQSLLKQKKRP